MSNFNAVSKLNTLWGNLKGDPTAPDWDKLRAQAKNILDEYNELMDDGIEAKNITEVRDAICDILVFAYGLGHLAGVPVDLDMAAVNQSNLSKFCKNEQENWDTVGYYTDAVGIKVHSEGEYPEVRVRSSIEQVGSVDGKKYQANKILKCVNWNEPVFADPTEPTVDTITISLEEYQDLTESANWLTCLESAGVDNWCGYDHAREIQRETDESLNS